MDSRPCRAATHSRFRLNTSGISFTFGRAWASFFATRFVCSPSARRALLPRPSSLVPRVSPLASPLPPSSLPSPSRPSVLPGAHDARRAVPRPLARDRAKLVRLGLHAQLLVVGAAARRQQVIGFVERPDMYRMCRRCTEDVQKVYRRCTEGVQKECTEG